MDAKQNVLAGFGRQIDLMNTINGGTTMTSIEIRQEKEGYVVLFSNPALGSDNYHIELKPDVLTVYTTLPQDALSHVEEINGNKVVIPAFMRHFPIPVNVEIDKIEAIFEEGSLKIIAPFKTGLNNFPKKLDIRQN
ncbi:MAG: Hsp20/alpha crystallin family protein [Microscillaceae bacterium]|nr:Hsp20/alpha crystallin family protein [Microscillaceae bacterium]